MDRQRKIFLLRILHTAFSLYFITCLVYLYYAAFTSSFNLILLIAFLSLAVEGFVVYVVNNGDCPLTYFQNKLGDNVPFFELFFPKQFAKNAFKFFSILTWGGVFALLVSSYLRFF